MTEFHYAYGDRVVPADAAACSFKWHRRRVTPTVGTIVLAPIAGHIVKVRWDDDACAYGVRHVDVRHLRRYDGTEVSKPEEGE